MNINESLRDWIESKQAGFTELDGVEIVTMGETSDLAPPFLGIMESGSDLHETNGVIMAGVSDYEITCELHTIPADADQDGTPTVTAQEIRRAFYEIIGDRDAIDWMTGRNDWRVFDIRMAGPTSEASDGRLITRWNISIVACPT